MQVAAALADGCEKLVIDLSAVVLIDSAMVHSVIRLSRTVRQSGVPVAVVVGENPLVRKLVDLWTLDARISLTELLPQGLLEAATTPG